MVNIQVFVSATMLPNLSVATSTLLLPTCFPCHLEVFLVEEEQISASEASNAYIGLQLKQDTLVSHIKL